MQAIGRAMRPQKCSREQAERNVAHYDKHGKSAHPPKMVLTINRYVPPSTEAATNGAPEPAPSPPPPPPESDDDEGSYMEEDPGPSSDEE